MPIQERLILASASPTRRRLLENANVEFTVMPAKIDEVLIKSSMQAEGLHARDIADALAEAKARKISGKTPGTVLGCDQVLSYKDRVYSKADSSETLITQLQELQGVVHHLFSAAVIYEDGEPVWRHVSQVRMTMHAMSKEFIEEYVLRNWDSVQNAVGGYLIEKEGIRLFSKIDGDFLSVLGLPLVEVLSYLKMRGTLQP